MSTLSICVTNQTSVILKDFSFTFTINNITNEKYETFNKLLVLYAYIWSLRHAENIYIFRN